MRKLLSVVALCMCQVAIAAGVRYASVAGAGAHTGMTTGSAWTLAEANANATAGDLVFLLAGTYTTPINPENSGAPGAWITFRNYQADYCSVYVSNGLPPLYINGKSYITVRGLHTQLAFDVNNSAAVITNAAHWWIDSCFIHGGSTHNVVGWGDWPGILIRSSSDGRFTRNVYDRQDHDITNDNNRGDGIDEISGRRNIYEGNTIVNVSHFGIAIPFGIASAADSGRSHAIVRNNIVYDCHVAIGQTNWANGAMVEGNRGYSPGTVNTYRGGMAYEQVLQHGIVRYNMFYDDTLSATPYGGAGTTFVMNGTSSQSDYWNGSINHFNGIYGNAFLAKSSNHMMRVPWASLNNMATSEYGIYGHDVLKNNIIGYPERPAGASHSWTYYFQNDDYQGMDAADSLDGNCFYHPPGDTAIWYHHSGTDFNSYTVAAAHTAFPQFMRMGNIERSPMFVDSASIRGHRSFEISRTSPLVDAGVALTTVASSASAGQKVVQVGNAVFFHYDWSVYDRGDSVDLDGVGVELDSVDYLSNRLITRDILPSTIAAGAKVNVRATYSTVTGLYTTRLFGSAPDIGPYEVAQAGGGSIPDSTSCVSPAWGTTQLQPTTLRWRKVAGATDYWLCVSSDRWTSLSVNNPTVKDTFYTVSGLPTNTLIVWNVKAGNNYGWCTDWCADFQYYTAATPQQSSDTLSLDWDQVLHSDTLAANTFITMKNLQRRDITVILHNPRGYAVAWDYSIIKPVTLVVPGPEQIGMYHFVREGTIVRGVLEQMYNEKNDE